MPKIDESTKRQRKERVWLEIQRHANGITENELAQELGIERRTMHNYLVELEQEGKIYKDEHGPYWYPLRYEETRLRPLEISPEEALSLYLGARLLSKQQDKRNEPVETALLKLAAALKTGAKVGDEIEQAALELAGRPVQPGYQPIFRTLLRGYIYRKQVALSYHPLNGKPFRTLFSTYLLEPSLIGYTTYIIGHSEKANALRAYRIERVESADLTRQDYSIPPNFNGLEMLRSAWSIVMGEERITVILRFSPAVRARVQETNWHPSQQISEDPEHLGYLLWQVVVADTLDLESWVRGWGADVEVLEPRRLREKLTYHTRRLARLYQIEALAPPQEPTTERLLRLWGKTERSNLDPEVFHPALFHMLDVGRVAQQLLSDQASPRWRKLLARALTADEKELANWLPWLVALHDIGKISAAFQENNPGQRVRLLAEGFDFGNRSWDNTPYHAITSAVFAQDEAQAWSMPEKLKQSWADALSGHHGQFTIPEVLRDARRRMQTEPAMWTDLRRQAAHRLKSVFQPQGTAPWPSPANPSAATMALTGFIILCDWLGSDEKYFRPSASVGWQEYLEMNGEAAAQLLNSADFFRQVVSPAPVNFKELFSSLENPRPLQMAIDAIPETILSQPCLAIIEAPTGEGKTEAALALAHRLAQSHGTDELYYALPTTATSNQMHRRVEAYLQEQLALSGRVKLVHGQAFLTEDELPVDLLVNGDEGDHSAATWFGSDLRKALLLPFGVGTVDQAELAALNVRYTVLRQVGLAGKVVIFDEVHAYDTYMTTIIQRLLNWLSALGTSVILLSATLPTRQRQKLIEAYLGEGEQTSHPGMTYPSLWVGSGQGTYQATPPTSQPDRRIRLDMRSLQFNDEQAKAKAEWLLQAVQNGGCACWITNTVDRAQEIFKALRTIVPINMRDEIRLLHARMPHNQRQRLETEIVARYGPEGERPARGIVIGTQVLEQSLDLDFDLMVSDLAPIDFLLQRAGRMHRHSHHLRPQQYAQPGLWINLPRLENGDLQITTDTIIYPEYLLQKTWLALQECSEIQLPEQYRPLVEAVYSPEPPASDSPLVPAWRKLLSKQDKAESEARQRIIPEPDAEWSFCARMARVTFDENETSAAWIVAQTRLGEESLTVIPLEQKGRFGKLLSDGMLVDLDHPAKRSVQKQILQGSLRLSNRRAVQALKTLKADRPSLFLDSTRLRDCVPLWLENNQTDLACEGGTLHLKLDELLGLVIEFEKNSLNPFMRSVNTDDR